MRRIDIRRHAPPAVLERARNPWPTIGLAEYFTYLGQQYALGGSAGVTPQANFVGYVRDVAERNGVVAGAVAARALLISQIEFVWRNNRTSATPGRAWSDQKLAILERPGPVTRPELLHLAEQDVSYAGSWYATRRGNELFRLQPDWISIVLGSNSDPVDDWVPPDARIVGYTYSNPKKPGAKVEAFLADEIIHWKPEPHPLEWWRGQSWITAVVREIRNDGQSTDHTSKFFEHAATPNMVFTMDPALSVEQVQRFADAVNERHAGAHNAYRNMFVGGGGKPVVVGSENAALNLRDIQGGYETRIATRSRVPAVVLGIREGMHGSALNAGNYSQTRRLWADGWFTPTVRNLCAALERGLYARNRPADSDLSYDPGAVLFLQEDQKDAAEIAQTNAQAIRALVEAGYEPKTVVDGVTTGDLTKLQHTGVFSVQLQPPGTGSDPSRAIAVPASAVGDLLARGWTVALPPDPQPA